MKHFAATTFMMCVLAGCSPRQGRPATPQTQPSSLQPRMTERDRSDFVFQPRNPQPTTRFLGKVPPVGYRDYSDRHELNLGVLIDDRAGLPW